MADEFSRLEELLDKLNDIDLKYQIEYEIDLMKKKFMFYKDLAVNGRDSVDAQDLKKCKNSFVDFISLDLCQEIDSNEA